MTKQRLDPLKDFRLDGLLLRQTLPSMQVLGDEHDALLCALIAFLFAYERQLLRPPAPNIPEQEGWIWLPKDVFGDPDSKPEQDGPSSP